MLIDVLGSGDSWESDYGTPLSAQRSRGWFKCDRRTATLDTYAYGILFPLFEFTSLPMLNGEHAVARNCQQYFHPRKALTSFYDQKGIDITCLRRVTVGLYEKWPAPPELELWLEGSTRKA